MYIKLPYVFINSKCIGIAYKHIVNRIEYNIFRIYSNKFKVLLTDT